MIESTQDSKAVVDCQKSTRGGAGSHKWSAVWRPGSWRANLEGLGSHGAPGDPGMDKNAHGVKPKFLFRNRDLPRLKLWLSIIARVIENSKVTRLSSRL